MANSVRTRLEWGVCSEVGGKKQLNMERYSKLIARKEEQRTLEKSN